MSGPDQTSPRQMRIVAEGNVSLACPAPGAKLGLPPRWARLNYPDSKKLWHAAVGHQAICGHVEFDHPRAEYSESKPERGKLCRRCVAKLARVA